MRYLHYVAMSVWAVIHVTAMQWLTPVRTNTKSIIDDVFMKYKLECQSIYWVTFLEPQVIAIYYPSNTKSRPKCHDMIFNFNYPIILKFCTELGSITGKSLKCFSKEDLISFGGIYYTVINPAYRADRKKYLFLISRCTAFLSSVGRCIAVSFHPWFC